MRRAFDAVLHDWYVLDYQRGHYDTFVLVGTVTGDRKGRFADGRLIRTSFLLTPVSEIDEGQIVQSLNTRYLLASRADYSASRSTRLN